MPKVIPKNIEVKIAQAFFIGLGRDETAKKYNVAEGKVSTVWKELKNLIGSEGMEVRDLSINLNKNDIAVTDAKKGAETLSILEDIGIDPEKLYKFIQHVYSRSLDKEYSAEDIIDDCKSINILEEEYNDTYQGIKNKFETMGTKNKEYNIANKKLKENITKNKMLDEDIWNKYETNKESLEHFKKMKTALTESGLDMNDTNKVVTIIDAIKKEDFNIKPIINKIEEIENLEGQQYLLKEDIEILEKKVKQLEIKKQKTNTKIDTLEKSYETRKNQITSYLISRQKGVTDEQIMRWEKIISTSNLNPTIIEDELKTHKNLKQINSETKKNTLNLKQREKELSESVHHLLSEKAQIIKSIETIQQTGVDRINKVTEITAKQATTTISNMNQKIINLQTRTQDALNQAMNTNQTILNNSEKSVKKTEKDLENISIQATDITNEVIRAIDKISNLHSISDAYKFIDTGEGKSNTVIPLTIKMLINLKAWNKNRNQSDYSLEIDINNLIEKLDIN